VRSWVGWVLDTLLGPEESGVGPGDPGRGLVGLLLFDSWIVDASIARTVAPDGSTRVVGLVGVSVVWVLFL
jgi:hypothetical protein